MHRLLKRQIERHLGGPQEVPPKWRSFIDAVDAAYQQSDDAQAMLEHSLELSSGELLQANSELLAVFQVFPDLFFRTDRSGMIIEHKGGEADHHLLRQGRLRGRLLHELPEPGVRERFAAALEEVLERKELVRVEYAHFPDEDVDPLALALATVEEIEPRYYEARFLPLLSDQVMVTIREITDRKQAEIALAAKAQELERSNAELQQFAYIASHDLQEPLRTVQSYLQLLRRRYGSQLDQDADEFIEFAFARVSSRARPLRPTPAEEVVDAVIRSLEVAINERDASITRDPLPIVKADRNQLEQLYQNLISNALKFNKSPTPRVHLGAERRGDRWHLTVRDNGIGIKPEHGERIFEIFKRLYAKDEYGGTGIGLAICKKIVERHGGQIGVESVPEEGSTFWFTLAPANARSTEI